MALFQKTLDTDISFYIITSQNILLLIYFSTSKNAKKKFLAVQKEMWARFELQAIICQNLIFKNSKICGAIPSETPDLHI